MRAPGPVEAEILGELAPTFTVREVNAGGTPLRVLEGGAGPAVVLLHGRGNAATTWFPILPELARGHRVVALDLPGFGASGAPPTPTRHDAASAIHFFTDPIEAFLAREGLGEAAIVGHSLGGRVALELALRRVVTPKKLVLIAAMGLGPEASLGARIFFRLGPEKLARRLGPALFGRISPFPATPIGRRLERLSFEHYTIDGGRHAADLAFRALAPVRGPVPHVLDRLVEVRAETLVLWGENDEALPAPMAIAAAARLPRGRLKIVPRGHAPHLEDPDGIVRLVIAFLDG